MLTRYLRLAALSLLAIFALSARAHHPGHGSTEFAEVTGTASVTLTGTVEALVVIDQVNAKTQRYPILVQGDGSRVALRGDAIQTLEAGAHVAVTGRQAGTLFTVGSVQEQPAPKSAVATKATPATVAGKFLVAHADNFEEGTAQFFYQVQDNKGNITDILMPFLPATLATGVEVDVRGNVAPGTAGIVPETITILLSPAPTAFPSTINYLVLPIKFPTNASAPWTYNADPFTVASLDSMVFGNLPTKSAKEFYKEASFGLQQLAGITVNDGSGGFLKSTVPKPATCDISVIASAAAKAANLVRPDLVDASGNPKAPYTGFLYVFNNVSGCGWAGLAYVGWPRAYSNNTSALWVIGHELGHNFGLWHAGSLRCPGAVVGCVNGSVAEYGDPFSSMGNSSNTGHFNAAQKDSLGWTTPAQTKTHGNGTATYTINPIETGGATTYGVRIPTANPNRNYWIEYRQPVGVFDAFIKPPSFPNAGAQVRIETPFERSSGGDDTELLDMTPATSSFGDAALLVGQTYTDSIYGVIINVLSSTASALTVQVTTPGTGTSTVTQTTSLTPAAYAAPITFTATVTGSGATGTLNFTEAGGAIAGCAPATLSGSGPYTATCTTSLLTPGTHSIVAIYAGNSTHAASASTALSQVVNKSPSTAALVSSLNPSLPAANVTFTATINGIAPTGTVNFWDGSTSLTGCGAVALSGSGNSRTAACSIATLTSGVHSITAVYSGDTINATSTSPVVSQGVGLTASTTGLSSSANPSAFGTPVTFTATVNGIAPTGPVNFTDGGTTLAGCGAVALTGSGDTRTAVCVAPALAAGVHSVSAAYAGNAGNVGSSSGVMTQAVNVNSATTVATSLTPSSLGSAVTFTATVSGNVPTGTVAFMDGAAGITNCATAPLTGAGNARNAVCVTTGLALGSHNITAVYIGDPVNIGSTSAVLVQDVTGVAAGAPVLQIAGSRKTHGAAGTFDLPLSLVPTSPSTESRAGATATFVLTFNKPLSAANVAVTESGAVAAAPTISGNDVVVDLTGVVDQQYVTVTLSNVQSADGFTGSGSVRVGFLAGDVNQSRVVSLADLAMVNGVLAQSVSASNFQFDVNANGTLTLSDRAITTGNLTRALPAP